MKEDEVFFSSLSLRTQVKSAFKGDSEPMLSFRTDTMSWPVI